MKLMRTALLFLLLLAGCYGSSDPPGEAPRALGAAPTPRWSEVLSATSLRVAAIGEGHAIVAGTFTRPLAIGAEHLVPRDSSDIFVSRVDALGSHLWTKAFAARGSLSSIAGGARDVVLAGASDAGVDLGGGALPGGPFLAKLDGSGEHVWSTAVDGGKYVVRVRTDGEGNTVALTGSETPGPFGTVLAKLDPHGRRLWIKRYGGGKVRLYDIAVTRDGDVIAVGSLRGSANLGTGPITSEKYGEALLVRYDPEGNLRWIRHYATPGDFRLAFRVATDPAGALFVGQHDGSGDDLALHKYDPQGAPLWLRAATGPQVMTTDASGDVIYATRDLSSGDTSLKMCDGEGKLIWYREWGEDSPEIDDLAITTSGALLVAGRFRDDLDLGGGVTLRAAGRAMFVASLGD